MRPALARILILSALLLPPASATAGPPFVTDDPEPVELRHFEFYLASQHTFERGSADGTLPHVEVNWGALPNLQLHVIAPLAYHRDPGHFTFGYGDTELGAKYRFVDESDHVPQIGTFPLVEVPTGNADKGLGAGNWQVFVPLWIQKSFGDWTTYGGGGYWFNRGPGRQDHWFVGLLLQRKILEGLTVGAEVFHSTAGAADEADTTAANLGAIIDFGEHLHLLGSAGPGFQGPTRLFAYLALLGTL